MIKSKQEDVKKMRFTVNTKPLQEALSLAVVDANINSMYQPSILAQMIATRDKLTLNFEASRILSEVEVFGAGDSDEAGVAIVSNKMLKQLVSTLDTNTITIEFVEGGIVIYSGKSKFSVPNIVDVLNMRLDAPNRQFEGQSIPVDKTKWKFIKDNQMYAVAMSFVRPVYTRVWIGDDTDVLTGDMDMSLFTHSNMSDLHNRCLITDTIVNLINSLPDGAELHPLGEAYVVTVTTDSYSYVAQILTENEDSPNTGNYMAEVILEMMNHSEENITINLAALQKILSQSAIFLDGGKADATIHFALNDNTVSLHDNNVDGKVQIVSGSLRDFDIEFKTELLSSVLKHFDSENISISILTSEGEDAGLLFWDDKLTTMLAGAE